MEIKIKIDECFDIVSNEDEFIYKDFYIEIDSNSNSDSSATGNAGTDSGTGNATSNDARSTKITPQPNVLDQFASYTYSASIYLLSLEQYDNFITSKGKTLSGYMAVLLLIKTRFNILHLQK